MSMRVSGAVPRLVLSVAMVVLFPSAPVLAQATDGSPRVTLPLSEYEQLRKLREAPSLTVVVTL